MCRLSLDFLLRTSIPSDRSLARDCFSDLWIEGEEEGKAEEEEEEEKKEEEDPRGRIAFIQKTSCFFFLCLVSPSLTQSVVALLPDMKGMKWFFSHKM